jgi:hypothetical protein
MMTTRTGLGVVVLLLAAGLAACTSGATPPAADAPPPTPTATAMPPAATATPPVPTATATPPATLDAPPATAACSHDDVSLSTGDDEAGVGHRSITVQFRNRGDRSCTLSGYPRLVALGAGGDQLAVARQTPHGYLGGYTGPLPPAQVVLRPGAVASLTVEAYGFILATFKAGPPFRTLVFTLPGDTASVNVPWTNTDSCDQLEVHPFVAGTTGRSAT